MTDFKDKIPPSGENLNVITLSREGKEISTLHNVGTLNEIQISKDPIFSRPLAEKLEKK